MNPFEFLDLKSFWSIWYWLLTIVTWSMTSHWTLGVPFDMIILAERKGEDFAERCEILIQINIDRLIYYFDKGGVFFSGFAAFMLAALGTLGFYMGSELFAALFMLVAPLTLVMVFTVRFAYKARRLGWTGEELRRRLRWRRLFNQVIGMVAIILTTMVAVIYFLISIGALRTV